MNPLTNILSLFDGSPWTTTDTITAAILALVLIIIIYQLIRWLTDSSERSDDHALGCLRTISWGCWLPLTLIITITIMILR